VENIIEIAGPYLPYVYYALPFILGLIALAVQGRLHGVARETVAAAYRVAIRAANELGDEGMAWLRSEAGIAYRRELAEMAYDVLPARIGPVPVGAVKLLVSREKWVEIVEGAFQEAAKLATRLELSEELPVN
jgi:hypothetical protein